MPESEKFFRVYSNLPITIRKEVILVIDKKPITWNVAYNEIVNKTKLANIIMQKLIDLDVV